MFSKYFWITIALNLSIYSMISAIDEPLGRNYRKNLSNQVNSHANNGKILSTSDSKISSVSYKQDPNKFSSFVDGMNLKTASSEDKFSIGLGVLSPSYSQKFGEDGKTKLDFNAEKGGFSYSLTNVVHPQPNSNQPTTSNPIASNTLNKVQSAGFVPSSYYNGPTPTQSNPQVNIYHKQTADPNAAIYGRSLSNNYPIPPAQPQPASYPANNPTPFSSLNTGSGNPAAASFAASAQQGLPYNYNPYNPMNNQGAQPQAPIQSQNLFNTALSDAEKSFLQTMPNNPNVGSHQHQPVSSTSQQQPITQPKLVAQQQLTANPNSANIVHNQNYAPYNNLFGVNPYAQQASGPNPYTQQASGPNPYAQQAPGPNPYQLVKQNMPESYAGNYPGLNMAASQQYPTMMDQFGPMNYDFLSDLML